MGERDAMTPQAQPRRRARLDPRARLAIVGTVGAVATALVLILLGSMSSGLTNRSSSAASRTLPMAKDFTLPALGHPGEHVSLSAYAGRAVIVNFFASWCSPCRQETPRIAQFYRSIHGRVPIIGVDVNDPSAAALKFVHADGVTYPVGVDAGTAPTASAYGLIGLPQTFFLNARHQIVKRVAGAVTLKDLQTGMAMIDSRTK